MILTEVTPISTQLPQKKFCVVYVKKKLFSSINYKVLNKLELVTGGPLDFLGLDPIVHLG